MSDNVDVACLAHDGGKPRRVDRDRHRCVHVERTHVLKERVLRQGIASQLRLRHGCMRHKRQQQQAELSKPCSNIRPELDHCTTPTLVSRSARRSVIQAEACPLFLPPVTATTLRDLCPAASKSTRGQPRLCAATPPGLLKQPPDYRGLRCWCAQRHA